MRPTDPVADDVWMAEALALARGVRCITSPNPWVGAVLVPEGDGPVTLGATAPPGGPHAEATALELAGPDAEGATIYVTLEPCSHHGRTPPCADALIAAGVSRVVVAVEDPDPRVSGRGIDRLRSAGIQVDLGVARSEGEQLLAPYLKHRRTGRPWVVLKMASTLDGRTAAADGTSKWITGPLARADAHHLRAESDAILVGAGTVRADDPALTVRHDDALAASGGRQPRRIVLGDVPGPIRADPALRWDGPLPDLLDRLGSDGVIQLLVEGGAATARSFHAAGMVDLYVFYLAGSVMGGDDGRAVFAGPGAASIENLTRGRIVSVRQLGPDLRIDFVAGQGGDAVA